MVAVDSLPLATCLPLVAKVTAGEQAPAFPPDTLLQVTVTAETGTVPQLVKELAAACTFRVQVLPFEPFEVAQLMDAAELPLTLPRSGSVAVKLIVPGLAVTVPSVAAIGINRLEAGITTLAFCCAGNVAIVQAYISEAPISFNAWFMWR